MKLKKSIKVILIIILIGLIGYGCYFGYNYFVELQEERERIAEEERQEELRRLYNACLREELKDREITAEIIAEKNRMNNYFRTYMVGVAYKDLITGFSFAFQEDEVFYGASLIKLLTGLYIYEKAFNENLDLEETVEYLQRHRSGASLKMREYSFGDEVSLRDLVNYSISVSDNTAHFMLMDYIGFRNLQQYGKGMGAQHTLVGVDNYGSMSAADAQIYLVNLYEFITKSGALGEELKSFMDNDYFNFLGLENRNITVFRKYGLHDIFFHNIGLIYNGSPYAVSILTHHGRRNYESVIKNIHARINDLHNMFFENRENSCRIRIYGE